MKLSGDNIIDRVTGLVIGLVQGVASAVNNLVFGNAATGNPPFIQASGSDTNIDLALIPKGTGWVRCIRLAGKAAALSLGRFAKALSDADYALANTEYCFRTLEFSGALTADRTMTLPLTDGAEWVVYNGTTGGHNLVFAGASGATVTVAATKTAIIRCDGTNIKRVTADA